MQNIYVYFFANVEESASTEIFGAKYCFNHFFVAPETEGGMHVLNYTTESKFPEFQLDDEEVFEHFQTWVVDPGVYCQYFPPFLEKTEGASTYV